MYLFTVENHLSIDRIYVEYYRFMKKEIFHHYLREDKRTGNKSLIEEGKDCVSTIDVSTNDSRVYRYFYGFAKLSKSVARYKSEDNFV